MSMKKDEIIFAERSHQNTKMSFLPAIPLPSLTSSERCGGILANDDGSLIAVVDSGQHCVYIYSVNSAGERTAEPIVVGTVGSCGSAPGQFNFPCSACFVHRNGEDTLLICDHNGNRVVETTAAGVFLRAIAVDFSICHLAYCRDVMAVCNTFDGSIVLLQYESGKRVLTIKTGTKI